MALRVDEVKTAKNQEEERDGQEEQGDECLEVDEMTEGEEREEEIDIKEEQGGETSSEELLSANERDDRDTHDHYLTGYISEVEDGDSREGAAGDRGRTVVAPRPSRTGLSMEGTPRGSGGGQEESVADFVLFLRSYTTTCLILQHPEQSSLGRWHALGPRATLICFNAC